MKTLKKKSPNTTKRVKKTTMNFQHNLIVLISTLNFINLNFKKYTQKNILYLLNKNLERNKQKLIKLKTLQNYLYILEKKFKVTLNYCKHLGKNSGSETYYKLKYEKEKCYLIINTYFKEKIINKINEFTQRIKKFNQINSSVKWECINNTNNIYKYKEYRNIHKNSKKTTNNEIIKKYLSKCNFKTEIPALIMNLKTTNSTKIYHLRNLKHIENDLKEIDPKKIEKHISNVIKENINNPGYLCKFFRNSGYKRIIYKIKEPEKKYKNKNEILKKILEEKIKELEKEQYKKEDLEKFFGKTYEIYKIKPHFIIEHKKYPDLEKLVKRAKTEIPKIQDKMVRQKSIKNNIFSILLEQLRHKVDNDKLIPTLKKFIENEPDLKYSKVFDNSYYNNLIKIVS
ncbi:plasmid maintenance protein [Borreliella burgdorferi]|uniref:plasmid maintenance protein n=1 Tax=Borreliella burgdorferi TaxID=139 RepID=UPI000D034A97|nr:plasmid maintenance protein [Borreliella burgdorferi]MCD2331336.1 plasmid maintenance protein [Borreliella burgdorferi]MCD2371405.1 plasmid maintenance protein [Borreliella burgdorferi]MCD2378295.1 plasmid maintenance protein [Borreliella burgdorferi]MCD2408769.1 plasmid maintenance protein [Borreliella burgdorferi]PRR17261.1 peptide transporter [Borreliella burgdorferi]